MSSNKKNGLFWLTQVYRLTPAKQRQALRRLVFGGLRWFCRKPWRVGFLLDAVGRVTSQVNSERPFFLVRTGPVRGLVRTKTAMLERVPAPQIRGGGSGRKGRTADAALWCFKRG